MAADTGEASAACNLTTWPCGRVHASCSSYDEAGLCPTSERQPLLSPSTPTVVFALCATSKFATKNRQQFGQHLESSKQRVAYLGEDKLPANENALWSNGSGHVTYHVSSPPPPSFGNWAQAGERCGFSQIYDTFNLYPTSSWYALGDDDTLWIPDNVLQTLASFPTERKFFLGSVGEGLLEPVGLNVSGWSNGSAEIAVADEFAHGDTHLTSEMAWGGGGMILSHKVISSLNASLIPCFESKRKLFGGDERISKCIWETSTTALHILPGFHQIDDFDATVVFQMQPPSPMLTLHHLHRDSVMATSRQLGYGIPELNAAIRVHPYSFLQQYTCAGLQSEAYNMFKITTGFDVQWQNRQFIFSRGETHPRVAMYVYREVSIAQNRDNLTTHQTSIIQEIHGHRDDHWAFNRRSLSCTISSMTSEDQIILSFRRMAYPSGPMVHCH